jgi:hypothetical protein
MANVMLEETSLIDAAVERLRDMLPTGWKVERSSMSTAGRDGSTTTTDSVIALRGPSGTSVLLAVEARPTFDPRTAEQMVRGLPAVIRSLSGNVPILAVAPWMSTKTQELLEQNGVNSLDLTGNSRISIASPLIFIRSNGAARNPVPASRGQTRVRGPKAGRLIRLLVDVSPPYTVGQVAAATGLAPGYVSRLLDALDREALVERIKRGAVADVDIEGLLRRWAESYDVFKSNEARMFLSPPGAQSALSSLADLDDGGRVAVTGSFAAGRLAPVAAPALLMAYSEDVNGLAAALGLLPADEGANVVLLRGFDRVVWDRTTIVGRLRYAAPSQVAVDCLTGTGRMPAEGQELLAWMSSNQTAWRVPSISQVLATP